MAGKHDRLRKFRSKPAWSSNYITQCIDILNQTFSGNINTSGLDLIIID